MTAPNVGPAADIWVQLGTTRERIIELADNRAYNKIFNCNASNELQWNGAGPLRLQGDGTAGQKKRNVQSMIVAIYGAENDIPCGGCEMGKGNHLRCIGFPGAAGVPTVSNGACANCIQVNRAQSCEWSKSHSCNVRL